MHDGFDPSRVKDVDLAFFDAVDLSKRHEEELEAELSRRLTGVHWDARNQAAVHMWYERRFGFTVEPLTSAAEGVAAWPETATAVAVRLLPDDKLQVTAPYGLRDLLRGVCRRNPTRVSVEEYRRRLATKHVATRWPRVQIIP